MSSAVAQFPARRTGQRRTAVGRTGTGVCARAENEASLVWMSRKQQTTCLEKTTKNYMNFKNRRPQEKEILTHSNENGVFVAFKMEDFHKEN